jgi:hypothetical protein
MSKAFKQMFDDKKDMWGVKLIPGRMQSPSDYPFMEYPLAYNHAGPS